MRPKFKKADAPAGFFGRSVSKSLGDALLTAGKSSSKRPERTETAYVCNPSTGYVHTMVHRAFLRILWIYESKHRAGLVRHIVRVVLKGAFRPRQSDELWRKNIVGFVQTRCTQVSAGDGRIHIHLFDQSELVEHRTIRQPPGAKDERNCDPVMTIFRMLECSSQSALIHVMLHYTHKKAREPAFARRICCPHLHSLDSQAQMIILHTPYHTQSAAMYILLPSMMRYVCK